MNMVNNFEIFDYFNFFLDSGNVIRDAFLFLIWRIPKKSMNENLKK